VFVAGVVEALGWGEAANAGRRKRLPHQLSRTGQDVILAAHRFNDDEAASAPAVY
jgi:hypothetical protein